MKKITMPKNRKDFIEKLKLAFKAGCEWAGGIEHSLDVIEQQELGASAWVGEITFEQANVEQQKIIERSRI